MPYKLVAFDLDGTLVNRDTEEILPGVVEYFQQLELEFRESHVFAVLTNQGGVGYGNYLQMKGDPRGVYPTQEQANQHIIRSVDAIARCLGWNPFQFSTVAWRYMNKDGSWLDSSPRFKRLAGDEHKVLNIVSWSRVYRKPNPGMLWMAMMLFDALPEETIFIGDRDEDKQAAILAGTAFTWAHAFFGRDYHAEQP